MQVSGAGCWQGADCLLKYPAVAYTGPPLPEQAAAGLYNVTVASPPQEAASSGFSGGNSLLLGFVVMALVLFGIAGSLLRMWRVSSTSAHLVSLSMPRA